MRCNLLVLFIFSGTMLKAAEPAKPSEATQKALPQPADVQAIQTLLAQGKLRSALDINQRLQHALIADLETWKEPDVKARFEADCKLQTLFKNSTAGGSPAVESAIHNWIGKAANLDELVARVKFAETLLQGRPKQEVVIWTGIKRLLFDNGPQYPDAKARQPVYEFLKTKGVNEKYLQKVREFFRDP